LSPVMNAMLNVGDKFNSGANYRGEAIPVIEWTVVKENKKSFLVRGTVNPGQKNWAQYHLYLNKASGKISN